MSTLIKTGIELEIKGIEAALSNLSTLENIQAVLTTTTQQLSGAINSLRSNLTNLSGGATSVGTSLNNIDTSKLNSQLNNSANTFGGFNSTVQGTVEHLQRIAQTAGTVNLTTLNTPIVDQSQIITRNATALGTLQVEIAKLNALDLTTINGKISSLFTALQTTIPANLVTDLGNLIAAFERLNKIDISNAQTSFDKFINFITRFNNIDFKVKIAEIDALATAMPNLVKGFNALTKIGDKTVADSSEAINKFLSVLRRLNDIDLSANTAQMGPFAQALLQLANSFRKFAEGAPGQKLPGVLKAVGDSLREFFSIFGQFRNDTALTDLTDDLVKLAPPLEQLANAFKRFATTQGGDLTQLPNKFTAVGTAIDKLIAALKNLDINQITTLQLIPQPLKELALAMRAFTSGKSIGNLDAVFTSMVNGLKSLTTLPLTNVSNDFKLLGVAVGEMAKSFRGVGKLQDLSQPINNLIVAVQKISGISIAKNLSKDIRDVASAFRGFFGAFDINIGSGNLLTQVSSIEKAIKQLKGLNVTKFAAEIKELSLKLRELNSVMQFLGNVNNLARVSEQLKTLQGNSQKTRNELTLLQRTLLTIKNAFATGIKGIADFGKAIASLPIRFVILELKTLKFMLINLPILIVTKTIHGLYTVLVTLLNMVKFLISIFNAFGKALNNIITLASKFANIFTAFKINKVAEDVNKMNKGFDTSKKTFAQTSQVVKQTAIEVAKINAEAIRAEISSRRLSNGLNLVSAATNAITVGKLVLFGGTLQSTLSRILALTTAMQTFKLVGNIFQRLTQSARTFFNELGRSTFNAISEFEQLSLQIKALLAKEFVQGGLATTVQDALGLDALDARFNEVLETIQRLAILSPFEDVDVVKTYRMAQSFGFASDEALRLTEILVDTSSAMGLSAADMVEVSKVFGQIKVLGKINAQDLNQLAARGINVRQMFKELGLTVQDVQKAGIEADEVIKLISSNLENDFKGAAAQASNTLEGLRSTFVSLIKTGQRLLFSPLFDSLKPLFGDILGTLQTDEFKAQLSQLGEVIKDQFQGIIIAVVKPIAFLVQAFAELPPSVQGSIIGFTKFLATSLAVTLALVALKSALLIGVTVFGLLISPITIYIAVGTALVKTLVSQRESIYNLAITIRDFLVSAFTQLGTVVPVLGKVFSTLGSIFPNFTKQTKVVSEEIQNLTSTVNNSSSRISKPYETTAKEVTKASNEVRAANTNIGKTVQTLIGKTTVELTKGANGFKLFTNQVSKLNVVMNDTSTTKKTIISDKTIENIKEFNDTSSKTGAKLNDIAEGAIKTTKPIRDVSDEIDNINKSFGATNALSKNVVQSFPLLESVAEKIGNTILFFANIIDNGQQMIVSFFNNIVAFIAEKTGLFSTTFNNNIKGIFDGVSTVLSNVVTFFGNAFTEISNIISFSGNNYATFFSDIMTSIANFGSGLMQAFADGIIGSVSFISQALAAVGKIIFFWLEPHSPPNLVPDIDKWGFRLAFEYINGFAKGVGETLLPVFANIGMAFITFFGGTLVNLISTTLVVLGGVLNSIGAIVIGVGKQIAIAVMTIANVIGILLDSSLSFRDKFLHIFAEIGVFFGNSFINIGRTIAGVINGILIILYGLSTGIVNELKVVSQAISYLIPNLNGITTSIIAFSDRSLGYLQAFGNNAAQFFNNLLTNITVWGSGLITAFADGILGALNVVAGALAQLGSLISFWLQPHSPPKLLPDIDEWGKLTAQEYLNGFGEADFKNISDFGNTVKDVLQSIGNTDVPDSAIGKFTQKFAEALATNGDFDTSVLQGVADLPPNAAKEIENLAKLYLDVAQNTKEVQTTTDKYNQSLNGLEDGLKEIDDIELFESEKKRLSTLQSIIDNKFTSQAEKEAALREQQRINAKRNIREIEAEKKAKEAALNTSQSDLDALKERLRLANQFNKEGTSAFNTPSTSNTALADEDPLKKYGVGKFEEIKGEVGDALSNVSDSFDDFFTRTGENFNGLVAATAPLTSIVDNIKASFASAKDRISGAIDTIKLKFEEMGITSETVGKAVKGLGLTLLAIGGIILAPIVIGAVSTFVSLLGSLLAPVLAIVVVIGALTAGLVLLGRNILKATGLFDGLSNIFGNNNYTIAVDDLNAIGESATGITKTANAVKNLVSSLFSNVVPDIEKGAFESKGNLIERILGFDASSVHSTIRSITSILASIIGIIFRFKRSLYAAVFGAFSGANPIDTFLSTFLNADYTGTFSKVITILGNGFFEIIGFVVSDIPKRFLFEFNNNQGTIAEKIIAGLSGVFNLVTQQLQRLITNFLDLDLSGIKFTFKDVELNFNKDLGKQFSDLLDGQLAFLSNIDFSTPGRIIETSIQLIIDTINNKIPVLKTAITNILPPSVIALLTKNSALFTKFKDELILVFNEFTTNLLSNDVINSFTNLGRQLIYAGTEFIKLAGIIGGPVIAAIIAFAIGYLPQVPIAIARIVDAISTVLQFIGDFSKAITDAILTGNFSNLFTAIDSAFTGLFAGLTNAFNAFSDTFTNAIFKIGDILKNVTGIDIIPFLQQNKYWIDLLSKVITGTLVASLIGFGRTIKIVIGTFKFLIAAIKAPFSFLFNISKNILVFRLRLMSLAKSSKVVGNSLLFVLTPLKWIWQAIKFILSPIAKLITWMVGWQVTGNLLADTLGVLLTSLLGLGSIFKIIPLSIQFISGSFGILSKVLFVVFNVLSKLFIPFNWLGNILGFITNAAIRITPFFGSFFSVLGGGLATIGKLALSFFNVLTPMNKIIVIAALVGGAFYLLKQAIDNNFLGLGTLFENVKNSIYNALTSIGIPVDNIVAKFTGFKDKVAGVFNNILPENSGQLLSFMAFLPIGFGKILNPVNLLTKAWGLLKLALTPITTLIGSIAGYLPFLTNPITLAIAAVTLLGVAWYNNWFDIQGYTFQAIDWITTKLGELTSYLSTNWPIWKETLLKWISDAVTYIPEKLGEFYNSIVNWITTSFPVISEKFITLKDAALNWISDAVAYIPEKLGEFLVGIITWIGTNYPYISLAFYRFVSATSNWITSAVAGLPETLKGYYDGIVTWITDNYEKLRVQFNTFTTVATNWITEATTNIAQDLLGYYTEITKWIGDNYEKLRVQFNTLTTIANNWVTNATTNVAQDLLGYYTEITKWIGEKSTPLKEEWNKFSAGATDWISTTITNLPTLLKGMVDTITKFITDNAGTIALAMTGPLGWNVLFLDWVGDVTGLFDLSPYIDGIKTWITTKGGQAIKDAINGVGGLVEGFTSWVSDVSTPDGLQLYKIAEGITSWITSTLTTLIVTTLVGAAGLTVAFVSWIPTLITDLPTALNDILLFFTEWIPTKLIALITTFAPSIITGFNQWITDWKTGSSTSLGEILTNITDWFTLTLIPGIVLVAAGIIDGIKNGIKSGIENSPFASELQPVLDKMSEIITNIQTNFENLKNFITGLNIPDPATLLTASISTVKGFIVEVQDAFTGLQEFLNPDNFKLPNPFEGVDFEVPPGVQTALEYATFGLYKSGGEQAASGLQEGADLALTETPLTPNVTTSNNSFYTAGKDELGTNLGQGVIDGAKETLDNADAEDTSSGFFSGVAEWFGIQSPSTKMYNEIGIPLAQGLLNGLTDTLNAIDVASIFTTFTNTSFLTIFSTETTTTLTGLKVNLLNVLTTMANDVNTTFINIITNTTTTFNNIKNIYNVQLNILTDLLNAYFINVTELTNEFSASYTELITTFLNSIVLLFETTTETIIEIYVTFVSRLITETQRISTAIQSVFNTLLSSVKNILDQLIKVVDDKLSDIVDAAEQAGIDFVAKLVNEIGKLTDAIKDKLDVVIKDLKEKRAVDLYNAAIYLGEQLILGIIKGIENKQDELNQTVQDTVDQVVQTGTDQLDVQSPSKVTEKLWGENVALGFARGIINNVDAVTNATNVMMNSIIKSDYRNQINQFINRNITQPFNNLQTNGIPLELTGSFNAGKDEYKRLLNGNSTLNNNNRKPTQYGQLLNGNSLNNNITNYNSYTMQVTLDEKQVTKVNRSFNVMKQMGMVV